MICRDLGGYFRDCGCSGQSGGVARFPGVTANAAEVHVLFVGRSIVPVFSYNREQAAELLKVRSGAIMDATQLVWDALGRVTWIPDDGEMTLLRDASADPAKLMVFATQTPIGIGPFEVSPKAEFVVVNGSNVQLPRADSRGREVLVFAWWDRGKGKDWNLDRTLGALVSLTRQGEVVVQEINRILGEKGRVWTYWLSTVKADVVEDAKVQKAIDEADVLMSHAPEGLAPVSMPFAWKDLDSAWARCGSCHEQAFNAWQSSKHRLACKTLVDRRREGDLRCITCHVQEFKVIGKGFTVMGGHSAVTCGSCHNKGEPKEACIQCHTDVTDPAKKYAAALKTICPGGTKKDAASCERR